MAGKGKPGPKRVAEMNVAERKAHAKKRAERAETKLPHGYLGRIRAMAKAGATQGAIAAALGLSPAGWTRLKKSSPRARKAYEETVERERADLHAHALKIALRGEDQTSARMVQYLLTHRHGYAADAPTVDPGGRVEISFKLPQALSADQYAELLRATAIKGAAEPPEGPEPPPLKLERA